MWSVLSRLAADHFCSGLFHFDILLNIFGYMVCFALEGLRLRDGVAGELLWRDIYECKITLLVYLLQSVCGSMVLLFHTADLLIGKV